MTDELVKLNLGAGRSVLPGFISIDRRDGKEVYPLAYDDSSVDEIYASHILEHFGIGEVSVVLQHWVEKLKPCGRIRIAVPDFNWVVDQVKQGVPIPAQPYVMGGQTDDNDFHKMIFDRETLQEIMVNCGLERIGEWEAVVEDCASMEVSLNLQGFKPAMGMITTEGVYACLSCPRYGPMVHMQCAMGVFAQLSIGFEMGQGAYWSHVLTQLLEDCIALDTCKYVLTCDYDTLFTKDEVLELYRLMEALPEWDAIMPIQQKRSDDSTLFGMVDSAGKQRSQIWAADFNKHVSAAYYGHFGLTMFRAASLRALPKPWMTEQPDPTGSWGEGRVDPDIAFWKHWKASGNKLGLANRVMVGHLQELVTWPGPDMHKPVYQYVADFQKNGIPKEARR